MTSPVTLLMAFHCHQPVGNFGFVFEQAYAKSYDPFLSVLERHPEIRVSLHYSGCLLDWLREYHPEFLPRVRTLVRRGQIELLASGYSEPILPLIPEVDRQGQIAQMRRALRRHCGAQTNGLWLTERVWEPDLPATLSRAGIRYTMVDANQFQSARLWLPDQLQVQDEAFWDLLGSYMTDHAGHAVRLFPASKRLRYWMPFQPVERTIEFLKRLRRDQPVAITFADDGEKFGLWPKTYEWVYAQGWLEQFFTALERERDWLRTSTFQVYTETTAPDGRVYLPCGSYEEMLEWSGGYFRNFFTKYPEAHAMQQKMLRLSERLQACHTTGSKRAVTIRGKRYTAAEALAAATHALYTAQCNCAYWHGVFGGLYLSHLRRAVYAHLIAAEQWLNQLQGQTATVAFSDVDDDGEREVRMATPVLGLIIDPAEGGTITEWSLFDAGVNLLDTLSRRPEPYHETLRAKPVAQAVVAGQHTPASIHELVNMKEENLASHLVYDDHRRSALLDYALQGMPSLQEVAQSTWSEHRLWPPGRYTLDPQPRRSAAKLLSVSMTRRVLDGVIRKTIRVGAARPTVECDYAVEGLDIPVVGLEYNVSLRDERLLKDPGEQTEVNRWTVRDPQVGIALHLRVEPPARLLHFPIETVSESEEGLERTYQGLCVICLWTLPATPRWQARLRWDVESLRTR